MTRRPSAAPRRAGVALVAALLGAVLSAGCGSDARTPSLPDEAGPHTAVTPRQAVQILATVDASLVRAVQSRDSGQLSGRAVGPAAEAIGANIRVQAALRQNPTVWASPSTPRLMLTLAGPWPRWFLAAGTSPAAATPLLEVLRSENARSPYGLWGQLRLLPGAVLPEVASAGVGAPTLPPDASGLAATPQRTLVNYTDLLNRGTGSNHVAEFADDSYRAELVQQLAADRKAFAARGVGRVVASHDVADGPIFTMPTRDGGALVIGRIDQKYIATVTPGRGSVRLDAQLAVLAGRDTVTRTVERRSVQVLAFHVPRAGSDDKIKLLAASKSDVAASGT